MQYELFISAPKDLVYLLEEELRALGMHVERVSPQGVHGHGSLSVIYRVCLWSRLAGRVHLILFSGDVSHDLLLRQLCSQFPWQTVFSVHRTFAVSFHGTNESIRNTMYGAQLIKDAIVDHFRDTIGERPSVNKENPEIRLHALLKDSEVTVSLDLSGTSLHQRAYRLSAGAAPLKEHLAAALLVRAGWPTWMKSHYAFHDPCCGSGTLVIEAAMMAANLAPGLIRETYGFMSWVSHDASLWHQMKQEALAAVQAVTVPILGTDIDADSVAQATQNAERAGVSRLVRFEVRALNDGSPAPADKGLMVCNPPYGERMDDVPTLLHLYESLGVMLHQKYRGWEVAVLTAHSALAKAIGLRAHKKYAFYNGSIPCDLYLFSLHADNKLKGILGIQDEPPVEMVVNRLTKNSAHLSKWAKRVGVNAYRLYDADLPEYAFAIDCYGDEVILQEYAAPKSIPSAVAERRRLQMMQAVMHVLKLDPAKLVLKLRKPQKGLAQYERADQTNERKEVFEGKATLLVNLRDYVDTGLFLDHRLLRMKFGQLPKGTRFLNLFCYTGTASVHAALAGAITTNVDLSNTYLRWAQQNFQINGLKPNQHQFIAFDVQQWLAMTAHRYDVIFLDPPSFSNSKRMKDTLDVQRDHEALIDAAMRVLEKSGVLYFSTNLRRFSLSPAIEKKYAVKDITGATLDLDFKRNLKIHQCYEMRLR